MDLKFKNPFRSVKYKSQKIKENTEKKQQIKEFRSLTPLDQNTNIETVCKMEEKGNTPILNCVSTKVPINQSNANRPKEESSSKEDVMEDSNEVDENDDESEPDEPEEVKANVPADMQKDE
jgi:5'-3' exonuclease